jgi:hypothetical protein
MQLDSVRELKANLLSEIVMPLSGESTRSLLALPAAPMGSGPLPTLALGIAGRAPKDYALAVRIQQRPLERSRALELIRHQARNEVDVRYVGRIEKAAKIRWHSQRHRPLVIGSSVAHHQVTAGTLGCFVRRGGNDEVLLLSNNHVLANENRAKIGDAILQPGTIDGGKQPNDIAATLSDFVKLKQAGTNLVDAAVARVAKGVAARLSYLRGLGQLAGAANGVLHAGVKVDKVGRTTGRTRGSVTAFELDNLFVRFDSGELEFNGQIEIEGDGVRFALDGDSGSLVVDGSRQAVGLLFAVSELGGSTGQGVAYANPFDLVLRELNVGLAR